MAKQRPPKVTDHTSIGDDVDLDRENVRLPDGTRLSNRRAEDLIDQVRRRGGRPSLTGDSAVSPRVSFRLTPAIRERAAAAAEREGKTISQLAREALEARIKIS